MRTLDTLTREYLCNDCASRIIVKNTAGQRSAVCGQCGGSNFIHEYELQRQEGAAVEVLEGLPPELAQLYQKDESGLSFDEARRLLNPPPVEI